jgi:hypothetical protein
MALTGRRPAEIFFSAKFSLPKKKLPYPAVIFDLVARSKPARLPTPARAYPILCLFGCKLDDLHPEVCGKNWIDNVLDKVRAHYKPP